MSEHQYADSVVSVIESLVPEKEFDKKVNSAKGAKLFCDKYGLDSDDDAQSVSTYISVSVHKCKTDKSLYQPKL